MYADTVIISSPNQERIGKPGADGNPYYIDEAGGKQYAYHPDHERLALCIGNDIPHLCLSCGKKFRLDSAPPPPCAPSAGRRHHRYLPSGRALLPVLWKPRRVLCPEAYQHYPRMERITRARPSLLSSGTRHGRASPTGERACFPPVGRVDRRAGSDPLLAHTTTLLQLYP